MNWSPKELEVKNHTSLRFALFNIASCSFCKYEFWLEKYYKVFDKGGKKESTCCVRCCNTRETAYDKVHSKNVVIKDVIERNAKTVLLRERERVDKARNGLQKILRNTSQADWQPGSELLIMETVVAIENTLNELEKTGN